VQWLVERVGVLERALMVAWREGKFDGSSTEGREEVVVAVGMVTGKE
jgi:hypothetical protein